MCRCHIEANRLNRLLGDDLYYKDEINYTIDGTGEISESERTISWLTYLEINLNDPFQLIEVPFSTTLMFQYTCCGTTITGQPYIEARNTAIHLNRTFRNPDPTVSGLFKAGY